MYKQIASIVLLLATAMFLALVPGQTTVTMPGKQQAWAQAEETAPAFTAYLPLVERIFGWTCSIRGGAVPCTAIYDPVCGVDGRTYPSACVALCQEGVPIAYLGPCATPTPTSTSPR